MTNKDRAWGDFPKLKLVSELEQYMVREYRHTQYCYYKPLDTINKILDGRAFWLTCVDGFNDLSEKELFTDADTKLYYAICLATGVTENLSMWYFYSGIDGKGGRVRMDKKTVRQLIDNGKYALYERENGKLGEKILDLELGVNMKRTFKDVLYFNDKTETQTVDLKYNTRTNHQIAKVSFRKYQDSYKGFLKSLIWYYEKETRLLIELTGNAKSRVNQIIADANAAKRNEPEFVVTLQFDDDIYSKLHIDLAPEVDSDKGICKENLQGIVDFYHEAGQIHKSNFHGNVDMRLCHGCSFKKKRKEKN